MEVREDQMNNPPESTTWRARTEDVNVTLRDVLVRSVVESAGQKNLAGLTINTTETFNARNDVSV